VLIREASNARNLVDLLPLVRDFGPEHCAFCTDDREPDFLVREGQLDQMCRVAVAAGIPAEDALLLATLNPAPVSRPEGHGRRGAWLPRRPTAAARPRLLPPVHGAEGGARGRVGRGGAADRPS
jgi:adenine deaminase